jgi:PAS domain S-box-containing protein
MPREAMAQMLQNQVQKIFGFIDRLSLAQKGRILFLGPVVAQIILLVGLSFIQVETADFYPKRAAQDKEISDAVTILMQSNHLALKGLRLARKTGKPPDEKCNAEYQKMLAAEANLEKYWGEFYERRKKIDFTLETGAQYLARWAAQRANESAYYHNVAATTTAYYNDVVQAAKQAPAPTAPTSKENDSPVDSPVDSTADPGGGTSSASDDKNGGEKSDQGSNKRKIKKAAVPVNPIAKAATDAQLSLIMSKPSVPIGPEKSTHERDLWFTLLLAYSAISLFYFVGFSVLFIKGMVNRLKVLNDNGQRFIARQELHTRISGKDEIARLDHAFHDMSDTIQNSSRGHRLMMDKASDIICSLNKSGRIESMSNSCLSVLGCEPDEIIGAHLIDFIVNEYRGKFSETIKKVIDTRSTTTIELAAVRKNRTSVDLLWSIAWSSTDNSVFCIAHDISETKRAERVQQELVQMVSHDLRSPLVAISGFHEFAERGVLGSLNELGVRQIASARRSTEQMLALVNDLLEAERLDSGMLELAKETVPLSSIVESALLAVNPQAAAKRLTMLVKDPLPDVFCDRHRMLQVVQNLVANAIKFSNEGGRVFISAAELDGEVRVTVADEGAGFPEQFKKTIFERYHQIRDDERSSKSGSGLGLTICRALVNLHGGKIWVDTEPGKGSKFHFTVPNKLGESSKTATRASDQITGRKEGTR